MIRIPTALAIALVLSGCATGEKLEDAFQLNAASNAADDAHCRSLLMQPGDLVYAQCRLALRKTYLNDYAARKSVIEATYGPLSPGLDRALRADAFCNYDESVKMVQQPLSDGAVAETAYDTCSATRQELASEFTNATGASADLLIQAERPTIIDQNVEAVREAKDVINGPSSLT